MGGHDHWDGSSYWALPHSALTISYQAGHKPYQLKI
jgi:hypothetical protein